MILPNTKPFYRRIDASDMLTLLENFPEQCTDALKLASGFFLPDGYRNFKSIAFSGMGGSAIGADLIRSFFLYKTSYPVSVIRNYRLPKSINRDTLFFVCSYSGNTEETMASFEEAMKRKAKIIVICSGGRILDTAKKAKIPYLIIPKGYPSRQALGYSFFSPLKILEKLTAIGSIEGESKETVALLKQLRDKKLSVRIGSKNNIAKKLATELRNSFPVIYGSCDYLDSVITRWRGQFAENSKTLSSSHVLPEMSHNEIVGWKFPRNTLKYFTAIMLRDPSEHKRVTKRIKITEDLLKRGGFKVREVFSEGKSPMARMFSLIYIGDFVSFYLAILNKVDPTPVEPISYLKKKLLE
jgi:glucose/mannose-6-phosphate isomerase